VKYALISPFRTLCKDLLYLTIHGGYSPFYYICDFFFNPNLKSAASDNFFRKEGNQKKISPYKPLCMVWVA